MNGPDVATTDLPDFMSARYRMGAFDLSGIVPEPISLTAPSDDRLAISFMLLNPEQEQVANHVNGRILTLAGPGSGKTKTLTERTGRLIKSGVPASNILCLTFTNKARDEMRERIAGVHGAAAAKVFISNFHGLCGIILRRIGGPIGYTEKMTVADSGDQLDLIMQVARKRGIEPTKPQARALATLVNDWRENLGTDDELDSNWPVKTIFRRGAVGGPRIRARAADPRPVRLQRDAVRDGSIAPRIGRRAG